MAASVKYWTKQISLYEREFKKWESRVKKILKRYTDAMRDGRHGYTEARFNILWSNVQVLKEATYNRKPKPDVSRRYRDQDPVGRVASLILERCLEYEIDHYTDFDATLTETILDRFLGGRGTAWVRYEPHFKAAQQSMPQSGTQITEDTDEPDEQIDYECTPVDYVHWQDFGHSVGRTWEEVTAVWRRVYLDRDACVDRFGEEIGGKIPLDSSPKNADGSKLAEEGEEGAKATIYEIWDNRTQTAIWLSKASKQILDERPDPLGLEGFFPCPKPLYATLTSDSLVPVPDFAMYQDQADELDILCDRIDGLVKALAVKGVYNAEIPELRRLLSEADNNTLIPVANWQAFAEKNGLDGAIDLIDIEPIAKALIDAYQAMDQVKSQVYELTGLADIMRGASDPNETLGAQELKAQYGSLRLKAYQKQVAQFADSIIKMKAQIICGKYAPQTIVQMAAVDQLAPADVQYVQPALQLLLGDRLLNPDADVPNPLRQFRIEVSADSMVAIDENAEKQARVEFLTSTGTFLKEAAAVGAQAPEIVPLLMEMLKFGVTGFKVGKAIEGQFDETAERLKASAAQPRGPDPAQLQQQLEQVSTQAQQSQKELENERMAHLDTKLEVTKMQATNDVQKIAHEADKQKWSMEFEKFKFELGQKVDQFMGKLTQERDAEKVKAAEDNANRVKESASKERKEPEPSVTVVVEK